MSFAFGTHLIAQDLQWTSKEIFIAAPLGETEVKGIFVGENLGSIPIKITSIKTSCECLTTAASRSSIAPGEKIELIVTFAVGKSVGPQERGVTVHTDVQSERSTILWLRTTIPALATLNYEKLEWERGEADGRRIVVAFNSPEPARVELGRIPVNSITYRKEVSEDGRNTTIIVSPSEKHSKLQSLLILEVTQGDTSQLYKVPFVLK